MERHLALCYKQLTSQSMEPVLPLAAPSAESVLPLAAPSAESVLPLAAPSAEPVLPLATPSAEPVLPLAAPSVEPVLPLAAPSVEPVLPLAAPSAEPVLPLATPSVEPVLPRAAPSAEPVLPRAAPSVEQDHLYARQPVQGAAEIYGKSVRCPHCNLSLLKKNYNTHLLRRHSDLSHDITQVCHLQSVTVDERNYIFAVQKTGHGFSVPVHVQRKTWGKIHKVKCELEECGQYQLLAQLSGLSYSL